MSFLGDVYKTIENSAITLFNSLHELTGKRLPSAKQINNLTKRIGFKLFLYAPSDYDSTQELRTQAKQVIRSGFKELAFDYIKELKERQDTEGLQEIAKELQYKVAQLYKRAKTKPSDYVELAHTLDIVRAIDPTYEEKFLKSIKPEHASALQEARKLVNHINNAVSLLNLTALVSGIAGFGVRTLLIPRLRSYIVKTFLASGTHAFTGLALAGSIIGELKKAEGEGRNPLTALFDPFTLALAYDTIYHGGKALKSIHKSTVIEDALAGHVEAKLMTFFNHTLENKERLARYRKEVKQLATLIEKVNPSLSDNLLKQINTNQSIALNNLISLRSLEAQLSNELRIFTEAVYNLDEVKNAFKPFTMPDGKLVVDANQVEHILWTLSKTNPVVRKYVETQRKASLLYALSKAYEDNTPVIHMRIETDTGFIRQTFNLNKAEDTFKAIFDEINKYLDQNFNVVLEWKRPILDTPRSVVIKSVYHPSVDDFYTLTGVFFVKGKKLEGGMLKDEFIEYLKGIGFDDDAIAYLRKQFLDSLASDERIILRNEPIIIPYSMAELGKSALDLTVKKLYLDDTAEIVYSAYNVNLSPARIFPSKLRELAKKSKQIANKLSREALELETEILSKTAQTLRKTGVIQNEEDLIRLIREVEPSEAKRILKELITSAEKTGKIKPQELQELDKLLRRKIDLTTARKVLDEMKEQGLISEIPDELDIQTALSLLKQGRKALAERIKATAKQEHEEFLKILQNDTELLKRLPINLLPSRKVKLELSKVKDLIKASLSAEEKLNNIASTLTQLIETPNFELRRTKQGFATVFNSYDDMIKFVAPRVWSRLHSKMEAVRVLSEVRDFLERLPQRNEGQELLLKFIRMVEGTTGDEFADKLITVSKFLGSVYTMNSLPIALGNLGQYIATASVLFPSLKLANPLHLVKHSDEILEAFREVATARHGVYSFHRLNPFIPLIQATLRASIKASIQDEDDMMRVLRDYARLIAKPEEIDDVAKELFEFYKSNKELLVDDLERIISSVDVRAMGTRFLKYAQTGEIILPWYRFIFTPVSFSLNALKQLPVRLAEKDLKAVAKGIGISTLLATIMTSETVPYLAPAEIGLGIAKDLANLLQLLFDVDTPDVLQQKDVKNAILSIIGDITGIRELHPADKNYIFENIGKIVSNAILGAEVRGNSKLGDILETGLRIFDLIFNLPRAGVVSAGAMSFGFGGISELPSPVLQTAKAIFRELFTYEKKEPEEAITSLISTLFTQLVPLGRSIIIAVEGRPLAKGLPAEVRDYYGIGEKLSEIPTEELYKIIGASWLVGFMAQYWDGVFTKYVGTALTEWFSSEGEITQSFKMPTEADYYKVINLRDSTILRNDENINYITAVIKRAKPEHKELIFRRLHRLAEITVFGRTKTPSKSLENLVLSEDFEKRKRAIENYIKIYERTKDYLTDESKIFVEQSIKNWLNFLKLAEEVRRRHGLD